MRAMVAVFVVFLILLAAYYTTIFAGLVYLFG